VLACIRFWYSADVFSTTDISRVKTRKDFVTPGKQAATGGGHQQNRLQS
jgi:hypothetical protein